jgi:hypothetical protein
MSLCTAGGSGMRRSPRLPRATLRASLATSFPFVRSQLTGLQAEAQELDDGWVAPTQLGQRLHQGRFPAGTHETVASVRVREVRRPVPGDPGAAEEVVDRGER